MISVAEAAKRKNVSPRTIRKAIERGEIVAERMGARLLMVSEKSLDKWTPMIQRRNNRKTNDLRKPKKSSRKS